MPAKKTPGRFTLQFNLKDPQQKDAADYLERQGRHKAQFLSSAILHYLHCPETPDIPQVRFPDRAELEELVLSILHNQGAIPTAAEQTDSIRPSPDTDVLPDEAAPELLSENPLGENEVSAILRTLSAFQGQ